MKKFICVFFLLTATAHAGESLPICGTDLAVEQGGKCFFPR